MDAETYKQLMLCLQQVKVTKPTKTDQSTDAKKVMYFLCVQVKYYFIKSIYMV